MKIHKKIVRNVSLLIAIFSLLTCLISCHNIAEVSDSGEQGSNEKTNTEEQDSNENTNTGDQGSNENTNTDEQFEIYSIEEFRNDRAVVSTDKGYGYVNTKGEIVIEPCYESAGLFHTDLARVKIDEKYGYINTKGELIIPAQYSSAPEKFDRVATVEKDGVTLVINCEGKVIYTARENDIIGEFCNESFWVESSNETISGTEYSMSYYDEDGYKLSTFKGEQNAGIYSSANEHCCAYVSKTVKEYGYSYTTVYSYVCVSNGEIIDNNIKTINGSLIQNTSLIKNLNQTITPMCKNGEWNAKYYLLTPRGIWDGLFVPRAERDVSNEYHIDIGYVIDSAGEKVIFDFKNDYEELTGAKIKAVYLWIYNGEEYYFILSKNTNGVLFSTIINPDNEVVCDPQKKYALGYEMDKTIDYRYYTYYYSYSGDSGVSELDWHYVIAQDTESGLFGYVDIKTGEWAIQPKFQSVTDFRGDGEKSVAVVNGNTIINTSGQIVFTIAD